MHELLQGLGWTNTAITVCEILFYVILILSGLIALIRQAIKCMRKLVPKMKEAKTIKDKLKFLHTFLSWAVDAFKDGEISEDELKDIDKRLDLIHKQYTKDEIDNGSI